MLRHRQQWFNLLDESVLLHQENRFHYHTIRLNRSPLEIALLLAEEAGIGMLARNIVFTWIHVHRLSRTLLQKQRQAWCEEQ